MNRFNSSMRRLAKWSALPAVAVAGVLAAQPAYAWDQQATSAQMDYELSQRAAAGGYGESGPYAQAFPQGRAYTHRHHTDR
jgi:hypothetical protein